ncbi:uncharacterized protein BX663DRAFT_505140 [Cokeromyces recurvatus]|uniref:uncharacterized protein n=1 Tax=Cokeromyces recurvatus TaxID=90255 RepID=UPI00221F303A|nr:uncharacterized protein BX663DRAFT_505140 [Cokeromyces recurvatus]KAI7904472.1 hypothetical protein BX663DRAFT_505140 [Cokeromyces recurvatus]
MFFKKYTVTTTTEYLPTEYKPRRIIVCLDGTWETPHDKTNVYKFYMNIDRSNNDWEYTTNYYLGLGAGKHPLLGGMFGYGISKQIISAYKFICRNYRDERDEIWLLGFSRGAYAVRSLAGMMYNVGLLPPTKTSKSKRAYRIYRHRRGLGLPTSIISTHFREENGCRTPSIHFLGCFDTVGALGMPKMPWYLGGPIFYGLFHGINGFHDINLAPIVKHAYHAMSIHEQRAWFSPTLMLSPTEQQTLEQIWFPGVHGDIGGQDDGRYNNILSCHTLNWMMQKAQEVGLKFINKIDTCDKSKYKFQFHDSYKKGKIYSIMPRTDREIPKDELTGRYQLSQIYLNGDFSSYLEQTELNMYPSKTLDNFFHNLELQKELDEDQHQQIELKIEQ